MNNYDVIIIGAGPGSRHVAVFEAPIDALSHATLQELEGWKRLSSWSMVLIFRALTNPARSRSI